MSRLFSPFMAEHIDCQTKKQAPTLVENHSAAACQKKDWLACSRNGTRVKLVRLSISAQRLELPDQLLQNLPHIAHQPEGGRLEDWGIGVLIDSHDDLRPLHACQMLDRA
jgi:hypothetical protein